MQLRYALLAVALVALVLVPTAAMAVGFGPKASPIGQHHGRADPGAGNATAFRANMTDLRGDGGCDGACLNATSRAMARNGTCAGDCEARTDRVCSGDGDRTQLRDRAGTCQGAAPTGERRHPFQARNQSAACR